MKQTYLLDLLIKILYSKLYRILLVLYSLFIIFSQTNYFDLSIYLLLIIFYLTIIFKYDLPSLLRLLIDFLLINTILFSKDITIVINYIYVLIPLFNSVNFTGTKKSLLFYVVVLVTLFFNFYLTLLSFSNFYNYLIPVIILILIDIFANIRKFLNHIIIQFTDIVDNYNISFDEINQIESIILELKERINKHFKNEVVKEILIFTISDKSTIKLISSTFDISEFKLDIESLLKSYKENTFLLENILEINYINSSNNCLFFLNHNNIIYVYNFIYNEKLEFIDNFKYSLILLTSHKQIIILLKKITVICSLLEIYFLYQKDILTSVHQNFLYIQRVLTAMHYIRNRLTPLKNLTSMVELPDVLENIIDNKLKKNIKNSINTSKNEIIKIQNYTSNLLDNNKNPYNEIIKGFSSKTKIFSILKKHVEIYLPSQIIEKSYNKDVNTKYAINEIALDLFLADWLSNMSKYKRNYVNISFLEEEFQIIITFINDYDPSLHNINFLIEHFNTENRNEITERTSHGIHHIKILLKQLKIKCKVVKLDNFKIQFQIFINRLEK